jgi:hypothetical protein
MQMGNHFTAITAIISPGVATAAHVAVRRHALRDGMLRHGMLRREGMRRA